VPRDQISNKPMIGTTSDHMSAILAAHQCQGRTNDCGPFAAAIVINALTGREVSGARLARRMDRPVWRGVRPIVRRLPRHATFPWGMVDVLRDHGLDASWRFGAAAGGLLRSVDAGAIVLPVVGSWRPRWAHYMVLLAYHRDRGWAFADPQHRNGALVWRTDAVFRRQWRAYGHTVVEVVPPDRG
jgi:hypothetical protein